MRKIHFNQEIFSAFNEKFTQKLKKKKLLFKEPLNGRRYKKKEFIYLLLEKCLYLTKK